jgi:3,4-dihydroxy-9,10-secoandrosta-1,3,5(10)-triene-9,17-dione 4,5-dioxygenase
MNICALGYVIIEATDLSRWERFATRVLGLMVAPGLSSERELFLKMDDYLYRIRVVRGSRDRFVCAGWELPGETAFVAAIAELQRAGIAVEQGGEADARARHVRGCARFTDPAGGVGEIFYGMPLDYRPLISSVGVHRFVTGYQGDMGLGHIAVPTPDLAASHRFYTQVMGFGQTDYMHFHLSEKSDSGKTDDTGQGLHFLHVNNPRHHSLALFEDKNPHPGELVHLMLEVEDLDTLGMMMDRVRAHDVRVITDVGRHTNDHMVSVYVESPAGFAIEYGFGGAQLNWSKYLPTESARTSLWGHRWGAGAD